MSNAVNWDLLSKLCRGRSLSEVQTEVESFYTLRNADLEKATEVLKTIFQTAPKLSHIRKPDAVGVAVRKMAGDSMDPALLDALKERCESVIDRDYKIERKSGVCNPFFIADPPSSRELAQNGAVR